MQLHIDTQVRERIPGVSFGTVIMNGVTVREHDEHLWGQVEALCQQQKRAYTLDRLSEHEQIVAVRALQRSLGFDPTRYRPSSEALLRRVLKGLELYRINTAVDVNNLCSLEFLLPICLYDLRHVTGQIRVRLGEVGETYPGIGRQEFHVENKVIIADEKGVMGNSVSDSERTKVTTATQDLFMIIYAPKQIEPAILQRYAEIAGKRMVEYNGGQISHTSVFTA